MQTRALRKGGRLWSWGLTPHSVRRQTHGASLAHQSMWNLNGKKIVKVHFVGDLKSWDSAAWNWTIRTTAAFIYLGEYLTGITPRHPVFKDSAFETAAEVVTKLPFARRGTKKKPNIPRGGYSLLVVFCRLGLFMKPESVDRPTVTMGRVNPSYTGSGTCLCL